ncbi:uncharacterized protein LOC114523172 isoform X2 [Dendronephthya gigantea]|uniref:uncharacterized protein LOC114523172 isoform X2 n=1 Tax=Dendronephthya gigantea TaxID=151771 RepID=UPI00106A3CF2|nr:uncharacterized protein LOC114523172 isoform X2 [Dendronephthya gigantea]
MASSGRKRRLVSSLDGEILERLSMKLNPRMLMKDYQSLAGRFKYTYEYIRNFARERDPTLALLQHWWSSKRGREKTVTVLIEHLSDMERDDCVDLLRPYEFHNSHEASELDERPVIPGAIDLNLNPYNPYFPLKDDLQGHASQHGTKKPDCREDERHQTNSNSFGANAVEFDHQQQTCASPQGGNHRCQWPGLDPAGYNQLNEKMFNMKVHENYNYNYPENPSAMIPNTSSMMPSTSSMMPSTSSSFSNGMNPASVSSSMDSLQFEKHFTENEYVVLKPVSRPQYQGPDPPQLNRTNGNMFTSPSADEFHGARRDLRLQGGHHFQAQPLDGSSTNSSIPGMQNDFMGSPEWFMEGNRDYYDNQFKKTGGNMRFSQMDYMGYESTATAGSHSFTAAADKVALVIGNQDYDHHKLRGLLYPEQDAADVASALTSLNFKVISLVNLTLSEMRTAMLAFCCLLGRGVYGVVYYAGHGYEDNGENYLLPVDSDLKYNREHSLRTQEILEAMQQCETSLNLLIIDACRVSLPNKSGPKFVPRIKRSAAGNNIFAYSCCSQQESLESFNSRNGIYCTHLLRRLRENRRVENILMDVATDFARSYTIPQRPCIETDSKADFRLTDPIHPEIMEKDFSERCRRWQEAKCMPHDFSLPAASLQILLSFHSPHSNILSVSVMTKKRMEKCVEEFHLELETVSPLVCVQNACDDKKSGDVICRQQFEIKNIQKHIKLQGSVMLTVRAMFKEDGNLCHYEKEVDLGWPLVSSITCLWDNWLLGDRCKMTAV